MKGLTFLSRTALYPIKVFETNRLTPSTFLNTFILPSFFSCRLLSADVALSLSLSLSLSPSLSLYFSQALGRCKPNHVCFAFPLVFLPLGCGLLPRPVLRPHHPHQGSAPACVQIRVVFLFSFVLDDVVVVVCWLRVVFLSLSLYLSVFFPLSLSLFFSRPCLHALCIHRSQGCE